MKIAVTGSNDAFEELTKDKKTEIDWFQSDDISKITSFNPDALFVLNESAITNQLPESIPIIFINSVHYTLNELPKNNNLVRINGWPGFLKREKWEIAGTLNEAGSKVLNVLGKKIIQVDDVPGFVSARVLAMIINEAYFAKQENVSTDSDIDIAMKLGTNYPKGPFEWAEEIGLKNICLLLTKLSVIDNRYKPAVLLVNTSTK